MAVYLTGVRPIPQAFFVTYLDFSLQQKRRKDAAMRQKPLLICKRGMQPQVRIL